METKLTTSKARRLTVAAGLIAVLMAGPVQAAQAAPQDNPVTSVQSDAPASSAPRDQELADTPPDDRVDAGSVPSPEAVSGARTGEGKAASEPATSRASEEVKAPGLPEVQDTAALSDAQMAANEKALAAEIGPDGASMGQGIVRLATSGDPQVEPESTDKTMSAAATNYWKPSGVLGVDVSSHQANVDWRGAWNQGSRFAYVKATESTNYINPYFVGQYGGSEAVGMLRGAYHFAIPSVSSGAQQANYFLNNGGGWTADGKTLPPLLDVEYNPYASLGNSCYNMSAAQMVSWIRDFSNTVYNRIGRLPMIYTTTDWWNTCTGASRAFASHPLHIANYNNSGAGTMPAGWAGYDLWQYTSIGPVVGDWNQWPASLSSLQSFARNRAADPAGSAGSAIAAVAARTSELGASTSGIVCGLIEGGCYQNFQGGAVTWTAGVGAHATINGAIRNVWQSSGFETGPLGYPTSAKTCGLRDGGCYQNFQRGAILWSSTTGAHMSPNGAIRNTYAANGFENGGLGYPTGPQICGITANGCYQDFQGGAIHWTSTTGAHATGGDIRRAWAGSSYETGRLGYPTSGETCGLVNGGCYQNFQGGAILWSSTTGARTSPNGAIRNAYAANGFERSGLGYPTSNETCGLVNGGCYQNFQGGAILWTSTTGARITGGEIRNAYAASGFETGGLGYPTSNETCGLVNGGCYQNFQGGAILWSPTTGARVTGGQIRAAYAASGFETGRLGYPTSNETCGLVNGGCYQNFQGGAILWSPTTGARVSPNGPIRTAYQTTGFEAGRLGYPTSAQTCTTTTNCKQTFQRGTITWTPTTGARITYS
ncbi:GH25 family lysozyme [Arthrobacter sp. MDT2-16]